MEIEVKNYTKVIKGKTVLEDVNLRFTDGYIYGIKGRNGSGKSMLLRAITGLIRPTEGSVIIDGKEIGKDISFPESVGALIDNPGFIPYYSGYKNLEILAGIKKLINKAQILDILKEVELYDNKDKKFKEYSLGMKQRLGIAGAIMEESKLIILDEPTNALDSKAIDKLNQIMKELKRKGLLVIFTSHDSEELNKMADKIICMESGKVVICSEDNANE